MPLCLYIKQQVVRHPSVSLYRAVTHDVTNTFIFTVMPAGHRAHLSLEVVHSNYPLENDSLFVVRIVSVVGFMRGFPSVLIMSAFVFILDWS